MIQPHRPHDDHGRTDQAGYVSASAYPRANPQPRNQAGLRAARSPGLITDGEEEQQGEIAGWAWWTGIVTERPRVSPAWLR
jgi:hypothetical protein